MHVAHAIIDGVIDVPKSKEILKDLATEARLSPDAVNSLFHSVSTGAYNFADRKRLLVAPHSTSDQLHLGS